MASADLTNRYVIKDNAGSAVPYDTLDNAASNIQTVIDYAGTVAGETVLVAAATYDAGGVTNWPAGTLLTNRVAITKAITVRSANNDPANTIIKGAWDPADVNHGLGPAAVRCVYMVANSKLTGFTLYKGATFASGNAEDQKGGGVSCVNQDNIILSNCVITGNSAAGEGGGMVMGQPSNCTISSNYSASYGGGTRLGIMYKCTLINNIAASGGGGTHYGNMWNCLIIGNQANIGGGGYDSHFYNCTIVGNSSSGNGGGIHEDNNPDFAVYNSISWGNNKADYGTYPHYSCGVGYTNGGSITGNITNDPMFIANGNGLFGTNHIPGNYRLSTNSPCINTGTNGSWTTNTLDFDGRTRIRYGIVDMGAYERINDGTIYGFH